VLDIGRRDDGTHDHRGIFIPPGVAHGFAAVSDMTITYLVDGYYNPTDELGVAWDDPVIGADWGVAGAILSNRDRANPRRDDIAPQWRPHFSLRT
jgi:dTDP-4-dehydrorhamnose 3,5-epimerase